MAVSRRSLIARLPPAAALLLLGACAEDESPVRIAPVGSPAPAGGPTLRLPREPIPQGGTFVASLRGDGIAAITAEFDGRHVPTIREAGAFLAILPAGQLVDASEQTPPGAHGVRMHYEVADKC